MTADVDGILEAIDAVSFVLDDDARVKRWNGRFSAVTGYDSSELESMLATEFLESTDPGAVETIGRELPVSGRTNCEAIVVGADGSRARCAFQVGAFLTPDEDRLTLWRGRVLSAAESPHSVDDPDGARGGHRDVDRAVAREAGSSDDREDGYREAYASADRTLVDLLADSGRDHEETLRRLLLAGCKWFRVDRAHLVAFASAREEPTVRLSVDSADEMIPAVAAGMGNGPGRPVSVGRRSRRGAHTVGPEPEEFRTGLGTVVTIDDRPVGSLWFTDPDPGERPFTDADRELADLLGRVVGSVLDRLRANRYATYLEAVTDAVEDGFYVFDRDGRLVHWNDRIVAVTGYSDAEIAEMTAHDFFEANMSEQISATISETFETGRGRIEAPVLTADGKTILYEFVGSSLVSPDGLPLIAGIARDITDRRRREDLLRERERQLSTIMDNIPGMVYRAENEPGWPFSFVSAGAEELTGYPGRAFERGAVTIVGDLIAADPDPIWNAVRQAVETDEPYEVTYPIETATGERRWLQSRGRGVFDEDGNLEAIEGVVIDVTDRERSRQALERTAYLLENAERLCRVGGWELDVTEAPWAVYTSDRLLELFGFPADHDLSYEEAMSCYLPADRARLEEHIEAAVTEGSSYDIEARIERRDGDQRWIRSVGEPVEADGQVVAVRGSIQDVTDRKTLEWRTGLLAQAGRIANVGGWQLDVRETLSGSVTDSMKAILGIDADVEVTSIDDVQEFVHPDDRERALDMFWKAVHHGESYDFEHRIVRPDGEVRWVRTIADPVVEDGEVCEIRGSIQDVTGRKVRRRELERTRDILAHAERLADVGGWELDLDDGEPVMTATDGVLEVFGLPPDTDLDFETALERFHPADRDCIREAFETLREDGQSMDGVFRFNTGDGRKRWARLAAETAEVDGEVTAIRGVIQDVTERTERERHLEVLISNLPGVVYRCRNEPSWPFEFVRGECEALTGYPSDRLVADSFDWDEMVVHPDVDREAIWEATQNAIEADEPFEHTYRICRADGESRWVRERGRQVETAADGTAILEGFMTDVTARKERELALESIHDATVGLLATDSKRAVADLIVDTAADVLDVDGVGIHLVDAETHRLEPVAVSPGFVEVCDGTSSVAFDGTGDGSPLWSAFVSGTFKTIDGPFEEDDDGIFSAAVESALVVPLCDQGVMTVVSTTGSILDETRRLVEIVHAAATAAFDRLETERDLRTREAELDVQNRRLERQVAITELIRSIHRSLLGAESREEIERTVCTSLLEAEDVAFAWIGDRGPSGERLTPRVWDGDGERYLDGIDLDLTHGAEPAARAVRTGEPVAVTDLVASFRTEPWRRVALSAGYSGVVSVPLAVDDHDYGVLAIYSTDADAFGELEQTVFAELGEGIANAITAANTRRALYAETTTELSLAVSGGPDLFTSLAADLDASVTVDGLGTHDSDRSRLFLSIDEPDADRVSAVLTEQLSVADHRVISQHEESCSVEVTVVGDVLPTTIVRLGGRARTIHADEHGIDAVVDVALTIDVREFVASLAETHGEVEVRSIRQVDRPMHTRDDVRSWLFEELTDRQFEVLQTAYYAGYFDWPRKSTGEEVAAMLDVSQPTVNNHLRGAQRRLLTRLFEEEVPAASG